MGAGEFSHTDPGAEANRREERVRGEFWHKVRRVAAHVPFLDDAVAVYYCALDPATPAHVRATLLGALAYFILPSDAIPDIVAGLGFTDDAAVMAAVVGLLSSHIRPRHRAAAARALGKELPESGAV